PNGETLSNGRLLNDGLTVRRGRVFDRNGIVLADSVQDGDAWSRVYPEPASAYVVGYYAPLTVGTDGLEASWGDVLSGDETGNVFEQWLRHLLHRAREGNDLRLTLDADLQRTAQALLGERNGAAILIEVETGRVLALASYPFYDPNLITATTPSQAVAAERYWQSLIEDPSKPLVQRATDGLYAPGSIFKVVTAAAAIDLGFASAGKMYEDDGTLNVEGRIIEDHNRPDERSEWSLAESLAWSLNVVFARVGLAVGSENLWEYASRFGFGKTIPFDVPVNRSQVASSPDFLDSLPAVADTSFGQGELLVSPLHMALLAAGIANGGTLMRPFLVEGVFGPDGERVESQEPEPWLQAVDPETAEEAEEMMVGAVEAGYASSAQLPGVRVGGKTGTAEVAGEEPHAWFIGFAGMPEPRYAVSVVLENAGAGMAGAQIIGRDLLAAALRTTSDAAASNAGLPAYVQFSQGTEAWPGATGNGRIGHDLIEQAPGSARPPQAFRGDRARGSALTPAGGRESRSESGYRHRRRTEPALVP
ncbi:MAG TPA: penicillin-binding transpeptidase domain-containing protein, partial [Thermomicrobiales bacterium]|nr:penicillin-binding transpeptidase domain-containing protein [Thermomicrobiales bacterium]